MNKRIIVLGSRGFIGSQLIQKLKKDHTNDQVIGISSVELNLEIENILPLPSSIQKTILIICSGLKRNHGETIQTFDRNLKIAENLSSLISNTAFDKIIYLSSCAVYGEDIGHAMIHEEQTLTPTSFYGISKTCTELLLKKSCGGKLIILRPPTIYAEYADPNNYDPYGFLNKIFNGETIQIWGDGTEKREFLYLSDLTGIISKLLAMPFAGTLNVCSGVSYSFLDIIQAAEKLTSKKANLVFKPRSKDKVDHFFDATLIHSLWPEMTFTSLKEGLGIMVYKEFSNV